MKTSWAANYPGMPNFVKWRERVNRFAKAPGYAAARALRRVSYVLKGRKEK